MKEVQSAAVKGQILAGFTVGYSFKSTDFHYRKTECSIIMKADNGQSGTRIEQPAGPRKQFSGSVGTAN